MRRAERFDLENSRFCRRQRRTPDGTIWHVPAPAASRRATARPACGGATDRCSRCCRIPAAPALECRSVLRDTRRRTHCIGHRTTPARYRRTGHCLDPRTSARWGTGSRSRNQPRSRDYRAWSSSDRRAKCWTCWSKWSTPHSRTRPLPELAAPPWRDTPRGSDAGTKRSIAALLRAKDRSTRGVRREHECRRENPYAYAFGAHDPGIALAPGRRQVGPPGIKLRHDQESRGSFLGAPSQRGGAPQLFLTPQGPRRVDALTARAPDATQRPCRS